jgi:excisionase family DNA binding protein
MADVITTTAAAERLGVTRRRVLQYIAEGRIRAHKMGRDYMVELASVEEFRPRPTGNPEFGPGYQRRRGAP